MYRLSFKVVICIFKRGVKIDGKNGRIIYSVGWGYWCFNECVLFFKFNIGNCKIWGVIFNSSCCNFDFVKWIVV